VVRTRRKLCMPHPVTLTGNVCRLASHQPHPRHLHLHDMQSFSGRPAPVQRSFLHMDLDCFFYCRKEFRQIKIATGKERDLVCAFRCVPCMKRQVTHVTIRSLVCQLALMFTRDCINICLWTSFYIYELYC
jgi:hypothetical protein